MQRKMLCLSHVLIPLFAVAISLVLYSCNTGNKSEQIVKNDLFSFSIPNGWETVTYDTSQYDPGDQIYETKQKTTYFKVYVIRNEGDVNDFETLINYVYRYMEPVLWPLTGPGKEVQFLTHQESDSSLATIPFQFKGKNAAKLAYLEMDDTPMDGEKPYDRIGTYIAYQCNNSIVVIYYNYYKGIEAKANKAITTILDSFQPNCK